MQLLVAEAGRRMAACALAAVQDVGLSEGAWWVLHELAVTPDGLALVQLAHRTGFSPSTVTGVTDHLAARGWIRRERATDDRRRIVAIITEQGCAVLNAGLARAEAAFTSHRDRLTPAQWHTLRQLLIQLTERPDRDAPEEQRQP